MVRDQTASAVPTVLSVPDFPSSPPALALLLSTLAHARTALLAGLVSLDLPKALVVVDLLNYPLLVVPLRSNAVNRLRLPLLFPLEPLLFPYKSMMAEMLETLAVVDHLELVVVVVMAVVVVLALVFAKS